MESISGEDVMSIAVSVDISGVEELRRAIVGVKTNLNREIAAAVNATAKKVRTQAARALKKELTAPVKVLKSVVKAKSKATKQKPVAVVRLSEGYPIPLKYFAAKKIKAGVTYKIKPNQGRRSILRKGFIIDKYGGNVMERTSDPRYPIKTKYGPSPGQAMKDAGIAALAESVARRELPIQMQRRIKLAILRAQGVVAQTRGRAR